MNRNDTQIWSTHQSLMREQSWHMCRATITLSKEPNRLTMINLHNLKLPINHTTTITMWLNRSTTRKTKKIEKTKQQKHFTFEFYEQTKFKEFIKSVPFGFDFFSFSLFATIECVSVYCVLCPHEQNIVSCFAASHCLRSRKNINAAATVCETIDYFDTNNTTRKLSSLIRRGSNGTLSAFAHNNHTILNSKTN